MRGTPYTKQILPVLTFMEANSFAIVTPTARSPVVVRAYMILPTESHIAAAPSDSILGEWTVQSAERARVALTDDKLSFLSAPYL